MAPKSPRLNAQQVERILTADGFVLVSQKGSHRKWKNTVKGVTIIVPYHKGRELPIGTLRSIINESKISEDKWKA